ncbi:MAG: glycoside hydrolase family 57, partial [Thermoplasmata archaeon]
MIYLAIVWHMHQPCYRDYLTGIHYSPWVRLHGVKDYLDMLIILEEFPEIKQTFNLTPVLLEQINFLNSGEEDLWFLLSNKKVGNLLPEEREFIIDNFFSCHPEHMVSLFPRFRELYSRRHQSKFTDQEILDLQVLFNLSWIDPYFRQRDEGLKNIVKKARFFSEEDKRYVLVFHKKILSKIVSTYKQYVHEGRIEITTTPFYHPILPLIYSTETARRPMPEASLPEHIFSFPEDARFQVRNAKRFVEELFECSI